MSIQTMLARVATAPVVTVAVGIAFGLVVAVRLPVASAPPPALALVDRPALPRAASPTPPGLEQAPTDEEQQEEADRFTSRWLRECVDRGGRWCCGQGGCCGLPETWIAPRVSMYFPAVTGPVPTATVEALLDAQGAAIQACYDREHLLPYGMRYLFFRLVLRTHGPATITIDGFDQAVADCVAAVLTEAPFPRPAEGAVTVTSSLEFR